MQKTKNTTSLLDSTTLTQANVASRPMLDRTEIKALFDMPKRFIKKIHERALAHANIYLKMPSANELLQFQFVTDQNARSVLKNAMYHYEEARRAHLYASKAGNTKTMKEVARTTKLLSAAKVELNRVSGIMAYVLVWNHLGRALLDHIGGKHLFMMNEGEDAFRAEAQWRAGNGLYQLKCGKKNPRIGDPLFHLKQVRREVRETTLHANSILQMIGDKESYSAWESVNQYRDQKSSMKAWAARHILNGPDGQAIPMLDILRSQAQARFNMLWSLLKALNQVADEEELVAVMVTLTLPGQYHPNPSCGVNTYDYNLSPAQGAKELQRRWSCIRADMHGAEIDMFGAWVIEPHKDATAHRHALVWLDSGQLETFKLIVRRYFPGGDVAADFKIISKDKGASAASYFAKYLVKTIDGGHDLIDTGTGTPLADGDHLEAKNAERVIAWRKAIRARSFDFFGLRRGTITAWHAIARQKEEPDDSIFKEVWNAIKERRGSDALRALGAVQCLSEEATTYIGYACVKTAYDDWTMAAVRLISDAGGTIELESEWEMVELEDDTDGASSYSYSHVSKGDGCNPPPPNF